MYDLLLGVRISELTCPEFQKNLKTEYRIPKKCITEF